MNPILQQLNPQNSMLKNLLQLKQGIQNPEALFQTMLNSNPQFAQFVQQNQGKTVEQIASAYGIDLNQIQQLLK